MAEACLALQDVDRQNVPLLLWALWSAERGEAFDVQAGAELAQAWDGEVVSPLRRLRRALKSPSPGLADADREAVREQVKAVELDAERRLLRGLEALPPVLRQAQDEGSSFRRPRPSSPHAHLLEAQGRAEALMAAAAAWGAPLPPSAFDDLLRRLNPLPA